MTVRTAYTILVGLTCALAIAGAFLPWASLDLPLLASITRSGYQGDGLITLLLGIMAAGFAGYLWFQPGPGSRLIPMFTAFLGVLVFAIAVINYVDTERSTGALERELKSSVSDPFGLGLPELVDVDLDSLVDTGSGVYVTMVAGAILALASGAAFAAYYLELPGLVPEGGGACLRCKARLPDGAKYCAACGQSVD
ncbi:MAG: zinc ribbon domain-containing protein [Chloroflexi bacterium]|nr:zinc ribbon domain-containing protein [Chloroflexota bacterium]